MYETTHTTTTTASTTATTNNNNKSIGPMQVGQQTPYIIKAISQNITLCA